MTTPRPGLPARGTTTGRPIMVLFDVLGQRWMLRIMWELHQQSGLTFRALQRSCGGVSSSVLDQRLDVLRGVNLACSDSGGYRLTDLGAELAEQHLLPLVRWSEKWSAGLDGAIASSETELA